MEFTTIALSILGVVVVGLVAEKFFTKKTTATSTPAAALSSVTIHAQTVSVASAPTVSTPIAAKADQITAGQAKINAWGVPAIDWTKVTAAELTAIYQTAIRAMVGTTTMLDYATGRVWVVDAVGNEVLGVPQPNFEIQGRVIRGVTTTESERAYVWHNNIIQTDVDSLNNKFLVDNVGKVTAR